jgi:hypothetical protein
MSNLEQALAQLVEALKAGRAYSHTATNEYERRFFLQELLTEIRRYQEQPEIEESDSISIVPAFLSFNRHESASGEDSGQSVRRIARLAAALDSKSSGVSLPL